MQITNEAKLTYRNENGSNFTWRIHGKNLVVAVKYVLSHHRRRIFLTQHTLTAITFFSLLLFLCAFLIAAVYNNNNFNKSYEILPIGTVEHSHLVRDMWTFSSWQQGNWWFVLQLVQVSYSPCQQLNDLVHSLSIRCFSGKIFHTNVSQILWQFRERERHTHKKNKWFTFEI